MHSVIAAAGKIEVISLKLGAQQRRRKLAATLCKPCIFLGGNHYRCWLAMHRNNLRIATGCQLDELAQVTLCFLQLPFSVHHTPCNPKQYAD
jgi:hypothetical protein